MKILAISNLFSPYVLGGYEILCGQVCSRLRGRGHDVHVLTTSHGIDDAETAGDLDDDGVRRELGLYVPFGQPARLLRRQRRRTGRRNRRITSEVIEELSPDVIFIWSQLRLTLGSARAAEASGVPVVYTFNDEHISGFAPARWGLNPRQFLRAFLDRVVFPEITLRGLDLTWTTSISHLVKNNLIRDGVPIPSCRIIYQGIPVERLPAEPTPGFIGRPARVLYAGQLHKYKGVHTLVEAVSRVAEQRGADALTLSIAGSGPAEYRAQLEQQAAATAAKVTFLGQVPHGDLPPLYRDHDILVFPSVWQEPFGLTHLEAMASGLPVISTADGGHGEFLEHEKDALVFPKEDGAALASALSRLLGEPSLAKRLADEGRRVAMARFSLGRYARDLETLLF